MKIATSKRAVAARPLRKRVSKRGYSFLRITVSPLRLGVSLWVSWKVLKDFLVGVFR